MIGFEIDSEFLKNRKFIKDQADLLQTEKVLKNYCMKLYELYLNQIGTPQSYPTISWLDYVATCYNWKIVGPDLTSQDIDRTFIATNFEEVDLEDNDDKALCRYEFIEIIARLAKIKYYDRGKISTVALSTEKLITEYVLPNSVVLME